MVTKIQDIVFDALHFTIRAAEGDFVPSASAYAFGRRPNYFKTELWLRPNVKNTASVILWPEADTSLLISYTLIVWRLFGSREMDSHPFNRKQQLRII